MAIPDYETLMLPVLELIGSGKRNVRECLPELQRRFEISDEEAAEMLPSGRVTVLASRAHWARTYLARAGLLESPQRNVHAITEAGRNLLASGPERIDNALLSRDSAFRAWKERSRNGDAPAREAGASAQDAGTVGPDAAHTPDDLMSSAFAEINDSLAAELLEAIAQGSPKLFERLVVDLLVAMGYGRGQADRGRAIGRSGDGGVDGIVNEDALGLDAVYV